MAENKTELLAKKQELEERLEKIRKDIAGGLDADFEEQATQLENREVLLEIQRISEEELHRINRKLADLDK